LIERRWLFIAGRAPLSATLPRTAGAYPGGVPKCADVGFWHEADIVLAELDVSF